MSGLKQVYDEHLLFLEIKCSKSHWDDLRHNLSLLWIRKNFKKVHDSETLWLDLTHCVMHIYTS